MKLLSLRPEARALGGGAEPLDIQDLLASLRRHLRLFVLVAVIVFAGVAAFTLTRPPLFTATATVLLNERTPDVLHLAPADAQATTDSSAVDTQAEVLKSRMLAAQVVDRLHLERDPEFNAALRPPAGLAALMNLLGIGAPRGNGADQALEREQVIGAVQSNLKVERSGTSYAINVSFDALEPGVAAALANTFVQQYLAQSFNAKLEQTSEATSWLDSRLAGLKRQVEDADAAVQQYKISHNLLSAEGATLTEQEISTLDTQLAQARAQEAEQDARLKTAEQQLASGSNGGDVGEAMNNPVVQTLRAQRAQASAQLANLQARYGAKHPQVLKAEHALADIDTQIQTEIGRVISSLKAQSDVAHTRTTAIAATANASRGTLANNNRASVELQNLQRDDDAAKEIYDGFLARYKESIAKQGNEQPDAMVISRAQPPILPSKPNKKLALALSLLVSLVAASTAVLAVELLTRTISSSDEVEKLFGLPALAEIPTLASTLDRGPRRPLDPIAYVSGKPLSRFTEAFRNLNTSIADSRVGHPPQIVALTSSLPGEGKTTTSVCLARTAAMSGISVVLVDCDLRQRSVNRMLAADPKAGLLEVLKGRATLNEALLRDTETGAMFLPLSSSPPTPEDVLGTTAMTDLIRILRSCFDLILLDTAPILAVADTRILCPQADAVVLLARWRKTSRKAIEAALRGFSSDTFIAGVALTQVNVREQARAGDGAAHYYRAYRKYYAS